MSTPIQRTLSNEIGAVEDVRLERTFSIWAVISISWNMINMFGAMSYMFVVGFSAGGIPSILYGFIGSSVCSLCVMAILAECASIYPTAGGAYHFSTFLAPIKYRRYIGYPLGWLNYLGWVFTIGACSSIGAGLTLSLVNLINPDFDVTTRWQLFLIYVGWATFAWIINTYAFRGVEWFENLGCILSMLCFVGFCIALLSRAPKADAALVFKDIYNNTGYASNSMAVVLGLWNTMAAFVCLDAACHVAEEIPNPARQIPRVLYITIATQIVVGLIYILIIGFSITDPTTIVNSPTGVPITEVIRKGLNSTAAAIVFNIVLIINYAGATTTAMIAASRQGYALARDGGLFWQKLLTAIHPTLKVPLHSINLCYVLTILIGITYLVSTQGFNALLGAEALFMIISYAAPSLMMLIFGRQNLKRTNYSLHRWGYPIAVVSVVYALAVVVLVLIPQVHPLTAVNMNYTILFGGVFIVLCAAMWFIGARKVYQPPCFEELVVGVAVPDDGATHSGGDKD